MSRLMIVLVFILYLIVKNGTYYYSENFYGQLSLSFLIFIMIYNWVSRSFAIFVFYICAHSIYFLSHPSPFAKFGINYDHYLQSVAGKGLSNSLLFLVLLVIPTKYFIVLRSSLGPIALISSMSALITYVITGKANGLLGATSIDSALIACTLPYLYHETKDKICRLLKLALYGLNIAAIFLLGGSVGIGCLVIVILFSVSVQNWKKYIIMACLPAITICSTYYFIFDQRLFNSSRRFLAYEISLKYFWEHVNVWTGTGISTYWVYGPLIQDQNNWGKTEYFTFMHSDIIQIFFEFGIIGLILFSLVVIDSLLKAKKEKSYLLAPIMAYLLFMTFYYPLHSFLTAFVGAIIYRDTIERE